MRIGDTYASALLETAFGTNIGEGELDRFQVQLAVVAKMIEESKDLRVVLTGPATSPKEKDAVLNQVCDRIEAHSLVRKFLALMARKNRLAFLADVRDAFEELRIQRAGGVVANLSSAESLTSDEQGAILKELELKFGRKVLLRATVDPRLVAGIKVTVNGVTYDGTLRAQLQRLRDKFVFGVKRDH